MSNIDASSFQQLVDEVQSDLEEANKFMLAASLNNSASIVKRNNLAIVQPEANFYRSEAEKLVELALAKLSDPELMTDPNTAAIRASIILRGASIASGLESPQFVSQFFELLGAPSEGPLVPSAMELELAKFVLARQEADKFLSETSAKIIEQKIKGGGVLSIFGWWQYSNALVDWSKSSWASKTSKLRRVIRPPFYTLPLSEVPLCILADWQRIVIEDLSALGYQFQCTLTSNKIEIDLIV